LADNLLSQGSLYGEGSLTGSFIHEMLDTPIAFEYIRWFKSGDPVLLQYLLTFLLWGKKMQYKDEDLYATAFRSWLEIEENLPDAPETDLANGLQYIIASLLPDPDPSFVYHGRHGNGAVAGPERGRIEKTSCLSIDQYLERITFSSVIFPEAERLSTLVDRSVKRDLKRVSRLMFVPKNIKTSRSICMEPTSLMYFQQAVRWTLEKSFRDSIIGSWIKIHDQSRNQKLADYGSWSGNVDTIDLSAASDCVTTNLVRAIFPRKWKILLLATRSNQVELPDGTLYRQKKFAPMGSALCFPVQSLIYCAVTIQAYALHAGIGLFKSVMEASSFIRGLPTYDVPRHGYEPLAVYGDDIICDSKVTPHVIELLTALGFHVNRGKSFLASSPFRESCGIYCHNGADITPLRFSLKHHGAKHNPNSWFSLVALCNRAGDLGYRTVHSFLANSALRDGIHGIKAKYSPVLFTSHREIFGIYTTKPRNTHLRYRDTSLVPPTDSSTPWYAREEWRSLTLVPENLKFSDDYKFEAYRYQQGSLAMETRGSPVDALEDSFVNNEEAQAHYDRFGAVLAWRWIPIQQVF
jgi:hypothetical protein